MDQNHRIALYLSGQYPGEYRLPDKLEIIFKIRELDQSNNFNDTMIGLLQGKSDGEFFTSLLNNFQKKNGEEMYGTLLANLEIPEKVVQYGSGVEVAAGSKETSAAGLQITQYIHSSIKNKFAEGLKSKLYSGAYVEAFTILNDRLRNYCNQALGEDGKVEMDAVDFIFTQHKSDNTFKFKRVTKTEKGMEEGLKALFEGAIKYYRNPAAHEKASIKTEEEFIKAMLLLSTLIMRIDNSKIGEFEKKQ